jgi:alpha-galactosidase
MLRDENGPKPFWGVYALDLTQQPVLDYIRSVFDRVFNQWGFGYIKIDFLVHAVMDGWRQDCLQTVAQAFRRGLQVIREVAGEDNFILGCGCPMGPAIGIVDGMRIGTDVSSRWFVPMNLGAWPEGNCCIRPSAVYSVWRQWMHRRWWQNDPDCLQVREDGSQPEKAMFAREFGGAFATEPPFGLSVEESSFWTRLVWFTGGMSLVSENMTSLAPERAAMLERAFPPGAQVPRVVDWYGNLRVPVLMTEGSPIRVGVFNMSDDDAIVQLPADRLGLSSPWSLREIWTGEELAGDGTEVAFPPVPAHGARIWELK